jgi:hypothetical protein
MTGTRAPYDFSSTVFTGQAVPKLPEGSFPYTAAIFGRQEIAPWQQEDAVLTGAPNGRARPAAFGERFDGEGGVTLPPAQAHALRGGLIRQAETDGQSQAEEPSRDAPQGLGRSEAAPRPREDVVATGALNGRERFASFEDRFNGAGGATLAPEQARALRAGLNRQAQTAGQLETEIPFAENPFAKYAPQSVGQSQTEDPFAKYAPQNIGQPQTEKPLRQVRAAKSWQTGGCALAPTGWFLRRRAERLLREPVQRCGPGAAAARADASPRACA